MIYTPLTRKALIISFEAHRNQKDKAGVPYIYHPYEVASKMTDENTTLAALLHDTVEDTSLTFSDLEREGFPSPVIEAVKVLTHRKGTPYLEYIEKVKENSIARAVKKADLEHNMNQSRMEVITPGWKKKLQLYEKALGILEQEDKR